MAAASESHAFKILVTGPPGVGKKSFAHFANKAEATYDEAEDHSVEAIAAQAPKSFNVGSRTVTLSFAVGAVGEPLDDDIDGIMLCFDVSDAEAFATCRDEHCPAVQELVAGAGKTVPVMVLGLKSDVGVATERPACNAAFEEGFGWEYIQFSVVSENAVIDAVRQIQAREIIAFLTKHQIRISRITMSPAPDFDGAGKGCDPYVVITAGGNQVFKSKKPDHVSGDEVAVIDVEDGLVLEGEVVFKFVDKDIMRDDKMFELTTTPEMFNSKVGRNTYVEYVAQELEVGTDDADKIPEGFKVTFHIADY